MRFLIKTLSVVVLGASLSIPGYARSVIFRLQFVGAEVLGCYGENLIVLQGVDTLLKYVSRSATGMSVDSVVMRSGYVSGIAPFYLTEELARRRIVNMEEYLHQRTEHYGCGPFVVRSHTVGYPELKSDPRPLISVEVVFYLSEDALSPSQWRAIAAFGGAVEETVVAPPSVAGWFAGGADVGVGPPLATELLSGGRDTVLQFVPALAEQPTVRPVVSVGTNGLYLGALVPNLHAEVYFARQFSFRALWAYGARESGVTPLGDANYRSVDRYGGTFRYWLRGDGRFTGHSLGLTGQTGQFDLKRVDRDGCTGSFTGFGIGYGYVLPLNRSSSLVVELGIEFGYMQADYQTYTFRNNGLFYLLENKKATYIGPTGADVSLTWRFGPKR